MSLNNIEVIYKVMIKRLVFTLRFPFNYLLGAYFWYRGRRALKLVFLDYDDLKYPSPLDCSVGGFH